MATQLETHIRQLFAYATLARADRIGQADVGFTFRTADLYLSTFAEAMDLLGTAAGEESTPQLLTYAQVFERFATVPLAGIGASSAARIAAAFYWLAGYGANALVLARRMERRRHRRGHYRAAHLALDSLAGLLTATLTRAIFGLEASRSRTGAILRRYLITGLSVALEAARSEVARLTHEAIAAGDADEYMAGVLLDAVLARLGRVSLWGSIDGFASAPNSAWRRYAQLQVGTRRPVVDLWPSQRTAVRRGLLDGRSSVVLRMPTSAGKTKLTELTLFNDLNTDSRRCLFLAPFRALVTDVESSLGPTLAGLGYPVASLYGASDANELEVALSQRARVVIATPEKMAAVLRLSGGSLAEFGTIVVDEGHLIGSRSRGVAFELQLASLRAQISDLRAAGQPVPRVVFLSAVLPNAAEIAEWLTGTSDAVAADDWHPTTMRVAEVTWGRARAARLQYRALPGEPADSAFFVPQILTEDVWRERSPKTGRLRTHKFPDKGKVASVAAALAFQAARNGPVLLYAQQPRWAESIGHCILERLASAREIETNLITTENSEELTELAAYFGRLLGSDALVTRAVARGFGVHHGKIPQSVRHVLEDAFRSGTLRLLIATSTVAQGVNFPAKTVVLHSLPGGDAPIRDFWNLAGRAGRATSETEGELLILRVGSVSEGTIRRFLNRAATEPAQSQLLALVRELLARAPSISDEAVSALLNADEEGDWLKALGALDTELLGQMAEDADGADVGVVERLTTHLFATIQAGEATADGPLTTGIRDLLSLRTSAVRSIAPTASARRRYARTTLTAASAVALDNQVPSLRERVAAAPELTPELLRAVIDAACVAPDLADQNAEQLTAATSAWISTGRYTSVLEHLAGRADTLDDTIKYVEEVIGFRLVWILNGLVRLLEPESQALDWDDAQEMSVGAGTALPQWLRLLPQFVRYGVSTVPLLWCMTLGIDDRQYAAFLLEQYAADRGGPPGQFRQIVAWLVVRHEHLRARTKAAWPIYFARRLDQIVARYRVLQAEK